MGRGTSQHFSFLLPQNTFDAELQGLKLCQGGWAGPGEHLAMRCPCAFLWEPSHKLRLYPSISLFYCRATLNEDFEGQKKKSNFGDVKIFHVNQKLLKYVCVVRMETSLLCSLQDHKMLSHLGLNE